VGAPDGAGVTVARTGPTTSDLWVPLAYSGTAIPTGDYDAYTGPGVRIPAGQASVTVPVRAIPDGVTEQDESAIVAVDRRAGAELPVAAGSPASASVTVSDTVPAAPAHLSLRTLSTLLRESDTQPTGANRFVVSADPAAARNLTLNFAFGGTAARGADYQVAGLAGSSASYSRGTTALGFDFTAVQDAAAEGDETFTVTLLPGSGYVVDGPDSFTVTLVDDDAAPPQTVPTSVSVRAAADAFGKDGSFANTTFGSNAALEVRRSSIAGNQREAYLRFDLSGVAPASQVSAAALRLYGRLSEAGSVTVGLYPVASTTWTEGGLTWNNRPAAGATAIVTRTLTSTANAWVEFDLTSYLKQQKAAGAASVSVALKATNYTTPNLTFASDEAAADRPELRVTQQATTPAPAIVLSQPTAAVPEGQSGAGPTVRLSAQPSAAVTVTVTRASGDAELTAAPATLTFTPANWNAPQALTLSAAQDVDATNGVAAFALTAPGLATVTLTATEQDDDAVAPPAAGPALDLLDSVDDSVIAPLVDGYVIDLAKTGTRLNVRATPAAGTAPGSLVFELDGAVVSTETYAPYSVAGDDANGFNDWTPPAGKHTLRVTQYAGAGGSGAAQGTTTVAFTVLPAATTPTMVSVRASADAYGLDGSFANTNYGSSGELQVRLSSIAGNHREAFLRFDLSQVASADRITAAVVRLTGRLSGTGSVTLGLYALTGGTNWTEGGLTWNNRPATGGTPVGALKALTNTANATVDFDLTTFLKQRKAAGATVVDLAVKATNYTTPYAIFASDEAAAGRPELRVTQA
ncbi:MAG: C-terminal target protein, partial [Phycisphaerales bacterium]|nr:C-terminal target protein [Phycisphaerales bacterium]